MLINGLGIGVPYKTFRGAGETLNQSSLYLPLKSTIVPSKGTSTPTFTRATTAWSFDNEGKLNLNVPSGCVRFKGGRLVRNRAPASEDMQNVGWVKGNVSASSTTEIVENGASGVHQLSVSITTFGDWLLRADVKRGSGTTRHLRLEISGTDGGRANFNVDTGAVTSTANIASGVLLGSGSAPSSAGYRTVWIRVRIPTSQSLGFYATRFLSGLDGAISYTGDTTSSFHVTNVQIENVSGQADQTASEYVSVGVLSSPYHGAGVDGCKWFPTNKDGSAIPSSTLEGYFAEPLRTNNCLWGRDLRNSLWDKSSTGAELLTNGTFADATSWTTTGASYFSISGGVININAPDSTAAYIDNSQLFSVLVPGKQYVVEFDYVKTSGGSPDVNLRGSSGKTVSSSTGRKSITITCGSSVAGYGLRFGQFGACVGTIDNVSVKEAAIQVTTTIGLDNVTNSASRLTAGATDATITQLLTAATGTRTLSAYIKRVSGTGTISLTRNGGTGWTDITSSLVTGSWVLVQMTSDVGANPTVGIKMGTSGDVIDVDCVQDENGAWATSPILTTTAAVTRNADVLSYASAFDVMQGTALFSGKTAAPAPEIIYALTGDTNGRMCYWSSGTARTAVSAYDGTTVENAAGLDITTDIRKRATRWGADLTSCADGFALTPSAFDGSMGASTTLTVGADSSGVSPFSGTIREVHIWPTPLTDAQMQQVTT